VKITAIRPQQKRTDRFAVFVDGVYSFSLSESAVLASGITLGQEIDTKQLGEYRQGSENDKLYVQTLRFITLRLRSEWEVEHYLQRKNASPALIKEILNKLRVLQLVDDARYAQSYIHDRQLARPTSRRKLTFELRKKHVPQSVIDSALNGEERDEQQAIISLIERKRLQTRYADDLKLMQYLSRQGFHYSDIKEALSKSKSTPEQ